MLITLKIDIDFQKVRRISIVPHIYANYAHLLLPSDIDFSNIEPQLLQRVQLHVTVDVEQNNKTKNLNHNLLRDTNNVFHALAEFSTKVQSAMRNNQTLCYARNGRADWMKMKYMPNTNTIAYNS